MEVISILLTMFLLLTVTLATPVTAYSADGERGSGVMTVKMSASEVQKWFDSGTSRGLLDIDLIAYNLFRHIGISAESIRKLSYVYSLHIKSDPQLKTKGQTLIYQNVGK